MSRNTAATRANRSGDRRDADFLNGELMLLDYDLGQIHLQMNGLIKRLEATRHQITQIRERILS